MIKLLKLLCGFTKGYSTQHALLRLVETCKECLDSNGVIGMMLTDLSKAYDYFLTISSWQNSMHMALVYLASK